MHPNVNPPPPRAKRPAPPPPPVPEPPVDENFDFGPAGRVVLHRPAQPDRLHTWDSDFELSDELLAEVRRIPGVQHAERCRYRLHVYRGRLFDWKPIDAAVRGLLEDQARGVRR